jgi:hypothetical protein
VAGDARFGRCSGARFSLLGQDVLVYGKQVLGFDDTYAGVPYALFAVGVGIGALGSPASLRRAVETGLIPLGAIGLAVRHRMLGLFVPGCASARSC